MMNKKHEYESAYEGELNVLLEAIQEAGAAILEIQQKGFSISKKSDREIVTQADLVANDILKTKLSAAFPAIGWLSEESVDDAHRLHCERVWIVDPIDGTKEFAEKFPEFAISVALIDKGMPIVSSVFNPATDELFYAVKGKGAWLKSEKIFCKDADLGKAESANNLLLLASRSEDKRGEWEQFKVHHRVKPIGSIAYKLALVAAGLADATFSLGPKHEWDIAAGTLLVLEAGGKVVNRKGQAIIYNQRYVKVDGIVATSPGCYDRVYEMLSC